MSANLADINFFMSSADILLYNWRFCQCVTDYNYQRYTTVDESYDL